MVLKYLYCKCTMKTHGFGVFFILGRWDYYDFVTPWLTGPSFQLSKCSFRALPPSRYRYPGYPRIQWLIIIYWGVPSSKLTVRPCQMGVGRLVSTCFHYKWVIFRVQLLIYQRVACFSYKNPLFSIYPIKYPLINLSLHEKLLFGVFVPPCLGPQIQRWNTYRRPRRPWDMSSMPNAVRGTQWPQAALGKPWRVKWGFPVGLHSGELTFCHGKSPFFMGKSTK